MTLYNKTIGEWDLDGTKQAVVLRKNMFESRKKSIKIFFGVFGVSDFPWK